MIVVVLGKTRLFSVICGLLVVVGSFTVVGKVLHVRITMVKGGLIHGTTRTKGNIQSKA